jgi:hypothetical protein
MASLIVAGNTSGTVTLQAPDVSGSTVLTLPTTSGTIVTTGGGASVPFAAGSAASPSITFTGDTNTGIFSPAADTIAFSEGGVESMRIDSSGNVGIGTSSPAYKLDVAGTMRGRGDAYLGFVNGSQAGVWWSQSNYAVPAFQGLTSAGNVGDIVMQPGGGNLLVGTTVASTTNRMVKDLSGDQVLYLLNSNAAAPFGLYIAYPNATPNSTGAWFLACNDSGTQRMRVMSNGGIANYSANDINLSDAREKSNVGLAGSYLDKICAIPVKTFNYIDQNNEEDGGLTLGVIAQDVQAVAPELVLESDWGTKEEPKMRLSVYQTDLQYALMKCIQEQQAIIQSQADTITAMEARLTALENK